MIKLFSIIVLLTLLSSCTRVLSTGCRLIGGDPDVSLSGYHKCGKKYSDAGKLCYSSSDCEGDCFLSFDWVPESGEKPFGSCAYSSSANGSWCTVIENHNNQPVRCLEE